MAIIALPEGSIFQNAIVTSIALLFAFYVGRAIYTVYFHPLSKYPGPTVNAFTRIPWLIATFSGRQNQYVASLHRQYGPIVRIASDELSFVGATAFNDIYGYGAKGPRGSAPPKHWGRYGTSPNGHYSMITMRNNAEHGKTRRIFSPAFSDRALTQQTPLFLKYVNQLVQNLRDGIESDNGKKKFDMVKMYNFTTFDVMGDLTFGESLHMLDNQQYDTWVSSIFASIKMSSRLNSITQHYPLAKALLGVILKPIFDKARQKHFSHTKTRVDKRLAKDRDTEGVDIWDLVLGQEDKGKEVLNRGDMDANASLFMIAGTETTATLLSGATYHLLKNPEKMRKLVEEIRGSFADPDEMSMEVLQGLPYLNACFREALRCYPPVPGGLPHLTPENGSTICGEFIPPGITVASHHFATYTSPTMFTDPMSYVPERWLGDEKYASDVKSALNPFSIGPRDCLGKNMAYHEMRLILAHVLFHFDMELAPESEHWNDQKVYILWEKHPLMVNLTVARPPF